VDLVSSGHLVSPQIKSKPNMIAKYGFLASDDNLIDYQRS